MEMGVRMRVVLVMIVALVGLVMGDIHLERIDREIRKTGLHRELVTNVTYTVTIEEDLEYCEFIFRENITGDMYVYYEEVSYRMPGFRVYPHHLPMDIEAPASTSRP